MLVLCDKCQSKYKITIKKNPGKPVTFKCGKCSNLIRIPVEQIAAQIGESAPAPEPKPEAPFHPETVKVACLKCGNTFIKPANEKSPICYQCRIDALVNKVKDKYGVAAPAPAPEVKESRYTIRSADGLVLGPIKLRTVSVLAREKRIKGVEEVSKDSSEYKPLMSYHELAELFPEMKEILDTTGLEDKVEEAFMAAFGGEEEEQPAEAAGAETVAPEEPPVPPAFPGPKITEAVGPAPPEPPPSPKPKAPEPPPAEPEKEPEAAVEEKAPEEPPVAVEKGPEQAPAPEAESTKPAQEPPSEETGQTEVVSSFSLEEPTPPDTSVVKPPAPAAEAATGTEEEDEVIEWGGAQKKEEKEHEEAGPVEEKPVAEPAPEPESVKISEPPPAAAEEIKETTPAEPGPAEDAVEDEHVGTEFDLSGEEEEEEEEIIEDLEPVQEPPPDARYRIRYPDGLILGPVKLGTIKELFNTGNLTGQEEVQRENEPWAGFAELPELAELVTETDVIAEDEVIELTDALEESG